MATNNVATLRGLKIHLATLHWILPLILILDMTVLIDQRTLVKMVKIPTGCKLGEGEWTVFLDKMSHQSQLMYCMDYNEGKDWEYH